MDTIVTLEGDDTEGNPLSFEIASGAGSPDEDQFILGASTGILTFNAAKDFEAPGDVGADRIYDITVQATAGIPKKFSDPLALMIRLTAVDEDEPPSSRTKKTTSSERGH